jgi:UDP-GlcNAc:undecaprenyl-phosphate/decaprenyl-phosphate GlcNAc-1-phosphate transferase
LQDFNDSFVMHEELLLLFDNIKESGFFLFGVFLVALILSFRAFPPILHIADIKRLTDEPDERSSHSKGVPTLGGVGIYASIMAIICFFGFFTDSKLYLVLAGSITVLFFLGIKDDIIVLSPKKKLIGQLLVSAIIVIFTNTRILGFSGLFWLADIPYWVSVIITVFTFILIINALNLTDGIDGLAGSLALMASLIYAILFFLEGSVSLAIPATGLAGAIIPFLRLNISNKMKIFMGDTGSMIIGFLLAFFTVSYINFNQISKLPEATTTASVAAIAILFYPLMDTLRIFIIRLVIHKNSPFKADKNHIHHKMLNLGFSHNQTTLIITITNLLLVIFFFWIDKDTPNFALFVLVLFGLLFFSIPFLLVKRRRSRALFRLMYSKIKILLNTILS